MPPSRCPHTARTPLQRCHNAALTPLHAGLASLYAALTQPSRRPHTAARCCSLSPRPPPQHPLFALHNAPTPQQRHPHAAARRTRAAVYSPHAAVAPPSRRCTPLLTVPTPPPPPGFCPPQFTLYNAVTPTHRRNAALAPLSPLYAPSAPASHVSRHVPPLPTILLGGGGGPGWAWMGMECRAGRGRGDCGGGHGGAGCGGAASRVGPSGAGRTGQGGGAGWAWLGRSGWLVWHDWQERLYSPKVRTCVLSKQTAPNRGG